jgi:hypothetical protein
MSERTCYPELGCFVADNYERTTLRAFSLLPKTPKSLDFKFFLYTMYEKTYAHVFKYKANVSAIGENFKSFLSHCR